MTKLYEISTIGVEKVDRERGIIPRVKILGRESKNGRTYSDRALKEAAKHYEGADVNVNHPDRSKPNAERRIEDGFGWLESVTVESDGVYGNLHYLKDHPSSGLIVEAAERRSNRFGLSHNAQGTMGKKDGKSVVESIERVISVDLVQNPATNNGLFESELKTIRETLDQHCPGLLAVLIEDGALLPPEAMDEPMAPAAPEEDGKASAKAALVQLLTACVEMPGDIKAICVQLIDVAQKIIAGQPEPETPEGEEEEEDPNAEKPGEETADGQETSADGSANPFKKKEKEMAESVKPKSTEERLTLLESENKSLKEELALKNLRETCENLLKEHKREVTAVRLTALANMPDDKSRIALIEDWPSNEEPAAAPEPRRRPNFSAPIRDDKQALSAKYPENIEQFVESCR